MELKGWQKQYLKGLAHSLSPMVQIGSGGLTENVIRAADAELERHELIKIRFNDFKDEKKDICAEIVSKTASSLVGMKGHVAIFYRLQKDGDKRKIVIPVKHND